MLEIVAKVLLFILPVKKVLRIMWFSGKRDEEMEPMIISNVKWALSKADRISLRQNRCLVQSIAGRWMLRRRGIASQIIFGVRHDEAGKLMAHAWLKSNNIEIISEGIEYCELAKFS